MFGKITIVTALVAALAGTATLAQGLRAGRAPGAGRDAGGLRMNRIQQALSLTETQMDGVRALQENRKKDLEERPAEVRQKRQALRQLMDQPNPNPSDVGNAALRLNESRETLRGINQRFISGFKGLLTPDQRQKLPKRLQ
jgi:Spy/CpxP family protein refolding chaperone